MVHTGFSVPTRFHRTRFHWELLRWLLIAATFYLGARAGGLLSVTPDGAFSIWMPIWFPSAIGLAAVLMWGARVWPGIFLGAFVTDMAAGTPWALALVLDTGNVLEALLAAHLIRRYGERTLFGNARAVAVFALAVLLGAGLSATIGVTTLTLGGHGPWAPPILTWWQWTFGNVAGAITLAPLLLVWREHHARAGWVRVGESVLIIVLALAAAQLAFGGWLTAGEEGLPLSFITLPFLVWAGLRIGVTGTAATILALSFSAAWNTVNGIGPFAHATGVWPLLLLQVYVGTASFVGLVLAAVVRERERAKSAQHRTLASLERRVEERTHALRKANAALQQEVAERICAEKSGAGRARVLEMLATGRPLPDVLHVLCEETEATAPGVLCAIMQLDEDKRRLYHVAAPSLPAAYLGAIDGIEIGPTVGSCGAASATGARVLVQDVLTHPYWHEFKDAAARAGLRACWAEPIRLHNGEVLGCVTLYCREPRQPRRVELTLLEGAAQLAGIAVERKHAEKRLHQLATFDRLTGLLNRPSFLATAEQALYSTRRRGGKAALLYLDIDNFKLVNDTLGHETGDQMLQEAGRRLQLTLCRDDLLSRLGGDEFTVLMSEADDPREVSLVADKLLEALARPFHLGGQEIAASASVGISLFPDDGIDASMLMKNADVAMYRAKASGRNNAQYFTREMNLETQTRVRLERELRRALARDELCLHYQPQWALKSGRVVGLEALVRWRHPERGLLGAADFIPAAEANGLVVPIGDWVLRAACEQAAAWRRAGLPDVRMAVNLSVHQLRQQDMIAMVSQTLRDAQLPGVWLEFELTETTLMENLDDAVATLTALQALGVQFAIDDFGTGYSSLAYLKRLPIDRLKIDRSFVRDLIDNPNDATIIAATIALGHSLNRTVLAEGVETRAQLEFLKAEGCDEVQGFFLGEPLPAEDIPDLLLRSAPDDAGRAEPEAAAKPSP